MGCSFEPIHAHRGFASLLRTEIWSILRSADPTAEEGRWVCLFIRSGILNMLAEGLGLIWVIRPPNSSLMEKKGWSGQKMPRLQNFPGPGRKGKGRYVVKKKDAFFLRETGGWEGG